MALLQGIFPTPGTEPAAPASGDSLLSEPQVPGKMIPLLGFKGQNRVCQVTRHKREGKVGKLQQVLQVCRLYMCAFLSSVKLKKKKKLHRDCVCILGTNSTSPSSKAGRAESSKKCTKMNKTCLWFRFSPGFVALLQTGKVVWELSDRSGMKLSNFSEGFWESSWVKAFHFSTWLQLTSPESFTISCSRCRPHNFLALLMSFSSRETRTSRSPRHR